MNKKIRIILIDGAKEEFERLNKIVYEQNKNNKATSAEKQLLNSIKQKVEFLKINPFYGENIGKNKIPKKYKVSNLWKINLNNFWRMLYTIKGDQIEVICFILDILSHKKYDKKFKYKKK